MVGQQATRELLGDALGVVRGIQQAGMLQHTLDPHVRRHTAQGQHQLTIAPDARRHLGARVIFPARDRGQGDLALFRLHARECAALIAEPPLLGQTGIPQLIDLTPPEARRDLMQSWLPNVTGVTVYQQDVLVACLGKANRQLQSAGTATDDDDIGVARSLRIMRFHRGLL